MGQLFSSNPNKLHGKEWREKQLRKIADKAFDRVRADCRNDHLTFEELYISVLYVYNDINKYLPGPHNDPPSKEKLKSMMEVRPAAAVHDSYIEQLSRSEYDINLDGLLDHEEFAELMQKLTADTVKSVGQNLLIGLVLVPAVALLAKRATEGVPVVGKVVQSLPNSIYASVIALGVVVAQKSTG
ncbi:hypothetical protein Cni_G21984 [Canna indica]|uniref:EF-hand domain-containing protein n=1 Tax=Canna indica TaxID=4628 RepID=A0AAQ3QM89_9LILI|nr:hypothetical protein Cni_G21984 [Canna indica]